MVVVAHEQFHEHGVGACGEMTLGDFGNLLKLGHHLRVDCAALKVHTDICAGKVTQGLGVHGVARPGDDAVFNHALDALVHGGA